ncbi:MAG: hypothetical protein CVU56_08255 [Deltaproteobacteria bacterium HGW-Deltaproteobacteria-14]|jgi:AAA family ATP:ADP antiporter|nr:MAG: hypothetical protein CVU56_08255 [Deltaproteobacteria bacterium HGW-Deltaproteobacteria-14]
MAKNPIKALLDVKKRELPLVGLMFGYFFLVITVFWILKPIKKTAFIGHFSDGGLPLFGELLTGAQAELVAKVLNMVVALLAALAFSALARTWRRQALTYVFSAFCALSLGAFLLAGTEGGLSVWLFYLFGDLFNTLMLATFFAFLNDSVSPEAAKRIYGPIVLGGVIGGAFGSTFVRTQISVLDNADWLWICLGLLGLIVAIAWAAGREVQKNPPPEPAAAPASEARDPAGSPALAGARLVARSRYLMAIVTIVGVYELVSTLIDFQFTATIEALVPTAEQGEAFSTVYAVTNVFAMVFQLVFTGAVLRAIGVRGALLVMPLVVATASFGYLVAPVVLVAGALSSSDNGLNYSLNQSAREALYTVTSRTEKYQAKAFIDMFVQRFAKALAVGLSLLITIIFSDFEDIRWLSPIVIVGAAFWFFAARAAGREFRARSGEG